MDKIVPPLKIWIYVASTVVLGFSIIFLYCYLKYPSRNVMSQAYIEGLRYAIGADKRLNSRKVTIIICGSSLSSVAFPNITLIEKKISDETKKVNILRISISGLNMEKAENSKSFDDIAESPPDYLFLEVNNLLINDMDKKSFSMLFALNRLMGDILYEIHKTLGTKPNNDFEKMDPLIAQSFLSGRFDSVIFKKALAKKHEVRKFSDNKVMNDAFIRLREKKTKIIFLNFPRSSKLESVFLDDNRKREFGYLLTIYKKLYNIDCWTYPHFLHDSQFIDGGHLNYKGSEIYLNWFCDKFNSVK